MKIKSNAKCPIVASLEILGDKWTLVILRDMLFGNKFSFSEIGSNEGIATNILNSRLEKLLKNGIIKRVKHPLDQRKKIYLPEESSIELIPVLVDLMIWSLNNTTVKFMPDIVKLIKSDREKAISIFESNIKKKLSTFEH